MRKFYLFVLVLCFSVASFAGALPDPDGKAVWDYITKNNYKSWALFPGTTYLYKGQSPHGAFLTSYINKTADDSLKGKKFANGSIIVKENYMPDKKLGAITVMYKVDGYNKEGNDWFWGKYSPEGDVQASGKVAPCISCHSAVDDFDGSFLKANLAK